MRSKYNRHPHEIPCFNCKHMVLTSDERHAKCGMGVFSRRQFSVESMCNVDPETSLFFKAMVECKHGPKRLIESYVNSVLAEHRVNAAMRRAMLAEVCTGDPCYWRYKPSISVRVSRNQSGLYPGEVALEVL